MNSLHIWTGPVASEKTTKALRHARRLLRRGFDIPFVVRPSKSVRGHEKGDDGYLVSKAGERFPSIETLTVREVERVADKWGAIWIDELMLYDDEANYAFEVVARLRKKMPVLISSLSATSELEPFGSSIPRLIAVADYVEFCRADCDGCNTLKTATRSVCLRDKDGQVLVGGEETYRPLCPDCWTAWMRDAASFKFAVPAANIAG